CAAGEDLTAVGDVEGDLVRAAAAERLREREVVDAGQGQRTLLRSREPERLQQPPDGVVGGAASAPQELLAPDVAFRPQRAQDATGVPGGRALRRAGRARPRGWGRGGDRQDENRRERGEGESHRAVNSCSGRRGLPPGSVAPCATDCPCSPASSRLRSRSGSAPWCSPAGSATATGATRS